MTKTMRAGMLVVTILALAVSCTKREHDIATGGRAKGKTFTVDNSGDAGQFVSMDMDVNDQVHMVYYDKKNKSLKYVRQSTAGFAIDTVDDKCNSCLYATIKVMGNGEPHVAFYSDSRQTLMYAYKREGVWKQEPIQWGKGTGMGARLLFDEKWNLHALYYAGDGYLMHAWRVLREPGDEEKPKKAPPKKPAKDAKDAKGEPDQEEEETEGIWGSERVDKANGSEKVQIGFVRRPQGGLAASYLHWSGLSSELRFAVKGESGGWKTEVVAREDNPGKSSALFYTPAGEPRIIFREARKDRLSMARRGGEGWISPPLIDDAYNMALATDATDNLLIAYEEMAGPDPRKGHLCFAVRKGGAWTSYEVDTSRGSGTHLDAAFTASGVPVIAYYEESGHSLKLFVGE
jgi:hypothetical protein